MPGITVAGLWSGPSHLGVRQQRRTPRNDELQPGCILWLPKKAEINERLLVDVDISDGCFNHPVVVLSTNLNEGKATVFIKLTSFKGQSLAEKYPENRRLRRHHLPISPSDAHPDNGILLYLDSRVQLHKKSYINTEFKVILNVASLRSYPRRRPYETQYKLKQSSYRELAEYITPTTDPYLPTPPRTPLQTIQHAPPQTPSRPPYSPAISNGSPSHLSESTAQRNAHAALLAATYTPVRTAPRLHHNPPPRAPPPQPYDPPSRTRPQIPYRRQCHRHDPPAREPPPEPLVLADLVPLLLLGSLGAAIYWRSRLSRLGKWALAVVGERSWGDGGAVSGLIATIVQFIRANASKRSILDAIVARGLGRAVGERMASYMR